MYKKTILSYGGGVMAVGYVVPPTFPCRLFVLSYGQIIILWTIYSQFTHQIVILATIFMDFKFPIPHTRGSSHGGSRVTRKAFRLQEFHSQIMMKAYPMWETLEKEARVELFKYAQCTLLF